MGNSRYSYHILYLKVLIGLLGGCCLFAGYYTIYLLNTITAESLGGKNARHTHTADEFIQVLIATQESQMAGTIALVNSIIRNTLRPVHFYFVADLESASHLNSWIENTKLRIISYEIKVFDPDNFGFSNFSIPQSFEGENNWKLSYARLYISKLFPHIEGRLICLSTDIIVQGDINNLLNVSIESNHFGALSKDCDMVSKHFNRNKNNYYQYLNLKSPLLKDLHIEGKDCVFNMGVMVLNMTLWTIENVTGQLEYWLNVNKKENIFLINSVLSPFLIVFHNRISQLENSWHVRHLGVTSGTRYSREFLEKAYLLHWDGRFKPWKYKSPYADLWQRYSLQDPKHSHKQHEN